MPPSRTRPPLPLPPPLLLLLPLLVPLLLSALPSSVAFSPAVSVPRDPSPSSPLRAAPAAGDRTSAAGAAALPDRISRIAVSGAGIGGLAFLRCLRDAGVSVTVYDPAPAPPSAADDGGGAGVQLNGALSVLDRVDPALRRRICAAGVPLVRIRSRTSARDGDGAADGAGDGPPWFRTLLELDVGALVEADRVAREGLVAGDGSLLNTAVHRGSLKRILYESAAEGDPEFRWGTRVAGVAPEGDGGGIYLEVRPADGGPPVPEGPYDLVIGADGIRSAVKAYVDSGATTADIAGAGGGGGPSGALYSGIRIQYALAPDEDESYPGDGALDAGQDGAEYRQYFGRGGYALSARIGRLTEEGREIQRMVAYVFQDPNYVGPFPLPPAIRRALGWDGEDTTADAAAATDGGGGDDENTAWRPEDDAAAPRRTLLDRIARSGMPDREVAPIVRRADTVLELGVYFHSPFAPRRAGRRAARAATHLFRRAQRAAAVDPAEAWGTLLHGDGDDEEGDEIDPLLAWSREAAPGRFCVLLGDAAHASPPFLGQGANQAVQDAYVLARAVEEYNGGARRRDDLVRILRGYEDDRWPVTTAITAKAALLGYLEVGGAQWLADFRDVFFTATGKLGIAAKVYIGGATPKV